MNKSTQLEALLANCGDRAAEKMESPFMSLQLAIGRVVASVFEQIADAGDGLVHDGWTLEMFVAMLRGEDANSEPSDEAEPSDG